MDNIGTLAAIISLTGVFFAYFLIKTRDQKIKENEQENEALKQENERRKLENERLELKRKQKAEDREFYLKAGRIAIVAGITLFNPRAAALVAGL